MLGFGRTLKYAYRSLRGSKSTSVTVILTLALGIGVTTAVFSIVYGVLLRPLPYPESDRLVRVWVSNPRQGIDKDITSYPNFVDWRTQSRSIQGMAAVASAARNLTGAGEPRELSGAAVSEGYFGILRVAPVLGRVFTPEEESLSGPNVVILSHELWATQFGSDPAVVGRALSLSGAPYEVVGVMPPGLGEQDFWSPLRPPADLRESRGALWLPVIGRLAPGVTFEQAQAEMSAGARRLEQSYPEANDGMGVLLEPLRASIVGDVRQPLLLLLGAVALVLLIACANIANVLLVRGTARRTEMAVRAALGASRRQLAMQVGAESLLLALAGGMLGVLAAYVGLKGLVGLAPPSLPRLDAIRLDGSVLGVTAVVTVLCGLLFGLVPALDAGGRGPAEAIKQGGRGAVGGSAAERLRPVLVVSQFALAVMLLAGAGLMRRSFAKMQDVDPGFDASHVALVQLNVPARKYETPEQIGAFYEELLTSLRATPGVASADAISSFVLGRLANSASIVIEGVELPRALERVPVAYDAVTPGLVQTSGMRLLSGRGLLPTDRRGSPRVALISETMARTFFRGADPVGARFSFGVPDSEDGWITIVGVVADARRSGPVAPVQPYVLMPHAQYTTSRLDVVIRATGEPLALLPQVRAAVHAIDAAQPISRVRTLEQAFGETVAPRRFLMVLLSVFGGAACVLAAIGIYGVMAYVVLRRTREIGVRIALGAPPGRVQRLVIAQAMVQAGIGLVLGVAGALLLGGQIRAQLFGVAPGDPTTLVATVGLLALVALFASWLPARRAAAVDPTTAMRVE
jgi:putative ABC transport system permease protein